MPEVVKSNVKADVAANPPTAPVQNGNARAKSRKSAAPKTKKPQAKVESSSDSSSDSR